MATKPIDQHKMEEFVHKVLGDTSALTTAVLGAIGDKLGLFRDLHAQGPASSAELAQRAGIQERYAREWERRHHERGVRVGGPGGGAEPVTEPPLFGC